MRIKDEDEKEHKDTVENTYMYIYCLELSLSWQTCSPHMKLVMSSAPIYCHSFFDE